eukprot:CAMPEP_0201482952 /NCGR_PEP_ID=MMETSP0151_2-20130828/7198_1 /ASSEMBLY_ACC=CAM_ASM_000257 /TAXON_ID=200890 /ORGANISM="Paramoeba atlantica, Strain 621/1 / CCAP 1560/9" /LENGTH=530 /DNA_ID=CAMNT_0047865875 /DNA_START=29 /DNA_END=1621 /DNA_ORIENTATION=-
MSLAFDEFGRPFVILKEQEKRERIKGIDAVKQNIRWARAVANPLRTSLGPRGMDKILVSSDNDFAVTNDGATILSKMDVDNEIASLVVQLSQSMDAEVGDGTTGVVVLAGALLEQAEKLLDKGIHPSRIADGFEKACDIACERLGGISEKINLEESLAHTVRSTLNSKQVNRCRDHLASICVQAVLSVADMSRSDVNMELIKVEGRVGGDLQESCLIKGIVLDKEMSHPQMPKHIADAKIVILTCPFEPPKPKTKHVVGVTSAEQFLSLSNLEQESFRKQVELCKANGASLVICQWGFDDEANYLLYREHLPAIRWVGGVEMELLAIATGARIVPKFDEITEKKLGYASSVREVSFGSSKDRMIFVEGCRNSSAVTIFLRAGSSMALEEAKRSVHDALCVARNLVTDNRIVYGGGSAEIACSLALLDEVNTMVGSDQYAVKAFAEALDAVPIALAENSGLSAINTLTQIKREQLTSGISSLGIDCMSVGTPNMKEQGVFETLNGKLVQLRLATQVVRMILKVDDVITCAV